MGMTRVKLWSIFSVTTIFNLLKIVNIYHLGLLTVNHTIIFPHTITHLPIYNIRCGKNKLIFIWIFPFEIV